MNTKYQMWLTFNAEKEKIQLPVLPSSFKTKNGSNNSSMDIVGLGEIVIMRSRPALQFSFSSFFPATRFPGVQVDSLTKPLALIERINRWKASKKPVHFDSLRCESLCCNRGLHLLGGGRRPRNIPVQHHAERVPRDRGPPGQGRHEKFNGHRPAGRAAGRQHRTAKDIYRGQRRLSLDDCPQILRGRRTIQENRRGEQSGH